MKCQSHSSRSVVIATLAAAIPIALGITVVRAQRPAGLDRPTTELFRGHTVAAGEVIVAFRRAPNLASLRAEIDAATDAPVGAGHLWRAHSRSRNVASLIAHLASRSDVLYAEPTYILSAA